MNPFNERHKTQGIKPQNPCLMKQTFGVCLQNTYDYSPFGVSLDGRTVEGDFYRHGFNGMEKDDEVKGKGNSYSTEFRQYDSGLGRWLSVDPKTHHEYSPYSSFDNNPIYYLDPKGADSESENKDDLNSNKILKPLSIENTDVLNKSLYDDGEKKKLSSLGMSKIKSVEENIDIITSDKMKKGDYFEGSDLNFLNPSASKAIEKLTKVDGGKFAVEDTWLAASYISEDATVTFVKGSAELSKKVNDKWVTEKSSGYWVYLHGMSLDGKNKFFLDGDKLYIKKEEGTMQYFKNLKNS